MTCGDAYFVINRMKLHRKLDAQVKSRREGDRRVFFVVTEHVKEAREVAKELSIFKVDIKRPRPSK